MFVKVNNQILDFEEYQSRRAVIQNDVRLYMDDLLRAFGFVKTKGNDFYEHSGINLRVKISQKKSKEEVFV